ncbi:MAG: response regulator [Motiliproteus sp.]
MPHTYRLLVATGHIKCREAIMTVARRHFEETELYSADTLSQSLDILSNQRIGLMLLDLDLSGDNQLGNFKEIRQRYPDTSLVVLASDANKELAPQTMTEGAAGFILSGLPRDQLIDALEQVLDGQLYQPSTTDI